MSQPKEGSSITRQSSMRNGQAYLRLALGGLWILVGTLLVAIGLEVFLIPNQVIDGGVVGISIMAAHLTAMNVGLFLFVLNLPFLWVGYRQIGRRFAITTLIAVSLMAIFVTMLHEVSPLTDDLLLAAIFGGVTLGLGVGLVIRNGGSLDGTEIVAIMLTRKWPFSVGEIVMFFNLFILGSAGFVFGWERAMYSLIAYAVAFRAIDLAIVGLEESKSVTIVTEQPEAVSAALIDDLGRGVTELVGKGGFTGAQRGVLWCVITRLELAKLRALVLEIDPDAFVAIENVHEVLGGRFRKKAVH